jgi:hypothetical protein
MSTELDQLAAARPEPAITTADAVTLAERSQMLDTILATPRAQADDTGRQRQRTPRRRRLLGGSLAAAAGVAALVIATVALPANSPGGPGRAGAATLERLAVTAAGGPSVGPGQFDFVWKIGTEDIPGSGSDEGSWNEQYWTAPSGEVWGYSDRGKTMQPPTAPFCIHRQAGHGDENFDEPTAAFLATFPTNPDQLRSFLRARVTGSSSKDEAVFVAVGDTLRTGLPSPALRAAAFRVLQRTGHITVTANARDARGRASIRVDFTGRKAGVDSLYFDPTTSRIMEEAESINGHVDFSYVTVRAGVVNSVPADLINCASTPHNHGLPQLPVH